MVKIIFIKDSKLCKTGKIVETSDEDAQVIINEGYAEYYKDEVKTKLDNELEQRKKRMKFLTDERLLKDNPLASKGTAIKYLDVDPDNYDKIKNPEEELDEDDDGQIPIIKPEVKIPHSGKLISEFAKEVGHILKPHDTIFFRPESRDLVEINRIHDMEGNIESIGFVEVNANRLITLIEKYMMPYVATQSAGEFKNKKKSINNSLAATLLESSQFHEEISKIKRIFTTPIPIMYEGKLTFPKKGYDPRFGSWLPYNAPEISNTEMTLEQAKQIIYGLYKEFCFKDKQDYTNAIAALLTPFLRGIFSSFTCRTPVFFYIANRERAGKDYCAGITSVLYEGYSLEEPPICNSEKSSGSNDELRKKVLAALMSGRKRLHFSNNRGYIDNAVFEGIITSEKYSDRMLGRNELLTFDNEIDFSLSGNVGIGFTADLANRSRLIRLFLDIEDANQRKFDNPNLHLYVKENRELILSALYALVRNWITNGSKTSTIPFASFPEWSRICGGIMEAAGYDSPCNPDKETLGLGGDIETQDMKTLFELAYEKYPEQWINKNAIRAIVEEEDNLFSYLDFDKKADQTKFGNLVKKFVGRVLSDIQLKIKDNNARSTRQELMFSKQKSEKNKEKIFGSEHAGTLENY